MGTIEKKKQNSSATVQEEKKKWEKKNANWCTAGRPSLNCNLKPVENFAGFRLESTSNINIYRTSHHLSPSRGNKLALPPRDGTHAYARTLLSFRGRLLYSIPSLSFPLLSWSYLPL